MDNGGGAEEKGLGVDAGWGEIGYGLSCVCMYVCVCVCVEKHGWE